MSRKQKFKPAVAVANRADDPYITSGAGSVQSDKFWRWGDDNLFPNALALMARRSVHAPPHHQRQGRLHLGQGVFLRRGA